MPTDSLTTYDLIDNDATSASDHLPVVVDFQLPSVSSTKESHSSIDDFYLNQNYPNPFNPNTTIEFSIPKNAEDNFYKTQIKVYDYLGSELSLLLDKKLNAGSYKIDYNAGTLSSGVYIYRLLFGNYSYSKKMVILK